MRFASPETSAGGRFARTASRELNGARIVITGVLTTHSIAFAVARAAQEAGAEIVLTSHGRARRITARAASRLPDEPEILELDVNSERDLDDLGDEVMRRWGGVDAALHSVAFAPPDAINGRFLDTPRASAELAFATSAYSLKALTAALLPAFRAAGGGSVVGLHLDSSRAWPQYDWMGVSKAALASVVKYLASYVGGDGVRVNLVASGLLRTPASSGFESFDDYAREWARRAPLGWDVDDPRPVADAVTFLFSPAARAITGAVLHVDGGAHAVEV